MTFAYCERIDPGFWAEPINALSNLAFVIAAATAWAAYRRTVPLSTTGHWDIVVLIGLAALIGAGSFLWHTVAESWAELADVIPIWLFVNLFLASFLLRIAGLGLGVAALLWLGFQLLDYGTRATLPAELYNGSVVYFPTLAALIGAAAYTATTRRPAAAYLSAGAVLLSVSLVFRSIDAAMCDALPVGTHFLWHLFNGVVLYALLRGLITTLPLRAAP
jgi:hypothetical protein